MGVDDLDVRIDDVVAGDAYELTRTITLVPSGTTLADGWFTVKEHPDDSDAEAIIDKQINTVNDDAVGHITDTGADGTGVVRFNLSGANTLLLTPGRDYYWDIQVKTAAADPYTPTMGKIRTRQGRTADTT